LLAQKKVEFAERNIIREPLSADELTALAARAGGAENLVAPKRRSEAKGSRQEADQVAVRRRRPGAPADHRRGRRLDARIYRGSRRTLEENI